MFFTFFKFYKWYQLVQNITYIFKNRQLQSILTLFHSELFIKFKYEIHKAQRLEVVHQIYEVMCLWLSKIEIPWKPEEVVDEKGMEKFASYARVDVLASTSFDLQKQLFYEKRCS